MKAKDFGHMKELLAGFGLIGLLTGLLTGYNPADQFSAAYYGIAGLLTGVIMVQIFYLPSRFMLYYGLSWLVAFGAACYFTKDIGIFGILGVNIIFTAIFNKYMIKCYKLWVKSRKKRKNAGNTPNPAQ